MSKKKKKKSNSKKRSNKPNTNKQGSSSSKSSSGNNKNKSAAQDKATPKAPKGNSTDKPENAPKQAVENVKAVDSTNDTDKSKTPNVNNTLKMLESTQKLYNLTFGVWIRHFSNAQGSICRKNT